MTVPVSLCESTVPSNQHFPAHKHHSRNPSAARKSQLEVKATDAFIATVLTGVVKVLEFHLHPRARLKSRLLARVPY
jgi:hypothetical protein